jgi:ABC-type branched-subunit amino acid transport system substrate-binding protein
VVNLCSDSSVSGAGIPWVIRITPRTDEEAQCLLHGLTNANKKQMHWAAVVPEGRAGREAAKDLLHAASAAGQNLAKPIEFPDDLKDWQSVLGRLLSTAPEGVLVWLHPTPAGELVKGLRQAGYKGVIAGPARLRSLAFLKELGPAAEGIVLPTIEATDSSASQALRFEEEYKKRFASEPDFNAMMAYDAGLLLMQILRQSGERPPFRAFPLKNEYTGASGRIRFDKDGNRQVELALVAWQSGRFQPFSKACPPPETAPIMQKR